MGYSEEPEENPQESQIVEDPPKDQLQVAAEKDNENLPDESPTEENESPPDDEPKVITPQPEEEKPKKDQEISSPSSDMQIVELPKEGEAEELVEDDSVQIALKSFMLPPTGEIDALELLRNMNFRMWSVDSMESIVEEEEAIEEAPEEVIAEVEEVKESEQLPDTLSDVEIVEEVIEIVDDEPKAEEEESDISIKSGDFVYVKQETVVIEETKEAVIEEDPRVKFLELCTNYGISQFINELTANVVDTCEYIDEDEILRGKLDANKLLQCLYEKYTVLQIQQRKRFLLNKKVADYFRRKKNIRAITDDPPDLYMNEIRRYRDSLLILDELKNKEAKTIALVEEKLSSLTAQLDEVKGNLALKIEKLNNHIREIGITTHYKKNSQLINEKLVDYYIRKMNGMRKEISKIRFHIIQQQHSIGVLQEKSKKLEELGDGLKMVEYEQLQTETLALAEKIEERNNELMKLRLRCNADTHIIAHIKEKQEMLAHKIALEQNVLNSLIDEQSTCRAYVHDLKQERDNIRKKYNLLSYKCGLLDKPQLLYDYDVTTMDIQRVQEEIAALKAEKASLLSKIEKYEGLAHKF